MNNFVAASQKIAKDSVGLFWIMLKTMVPVMILVRVAMELGLVDYLGVVLEPLMGLMGLPAATGLVLAVGLLVNTYAAVAVMITLLPVESLTVADVTVLLSVVLIAHALPLEQSISRRAGVSFLFSPASVCGGCQLRAGSEPDLFGWRLAAATTGTFVVALYPDP